MGCHSLSYYLSGTFLWRRDHRGSGRGTKKPGRRLGVSRTRTGHLWARLVNRRKRVGAGGQGDPGETEEAWPLALHSFLQVDQGRVSSHGGCRVLVRTQKPDPGAGLSLGSTGHCPVGGSPGGEALQPREGQPRGPQETEGCLVDPPPRPCSDGPSPHSSPAAAPRSQGCAGWFHLEAAF